MILPGEIEISKPDSTKCQHCGNPSAEPYDGYSSKIVVFPLLHIVRCPKCKFSYRNEPKAGRSGYERSEITEEQKLSRQVGKLSECCGVPYEQVSERWKQLLCNKCNFPFFGAHSEVSWEVR